MKQHYEVLMRNPSGTEWQYITGGRTQSEARKNAIRRAVDDGLHTFSGNRQNVRIVKIRRL